MSVSCPKCRGVDYVRDLATGEYLCVCGYVFDQNELDEREKIILPMGVPEEFKAFVESMAVEYNRHRIDNGDSWKKAGSWYLYQLLKGSYVKSFDAVEENPSHLLDIANYCWFLWYKLMEEKR